MEPRSRFSLNTPADPDPRTWLTEERRDQLVRQTASARPLLLQAGLWDATLGYWVREQASLEYCWDPEDEQRCLNELEEQWNADSGSDSRNLDPDILRAKLRVSPAAARWCKEQWGHRLDSLFLQTKNQLDRASCRLIRLRNKSLATELYHRIKAKEVSFAEVARDFGEGPERHKDGLITLRPLGSMPFGIEAVLTHLSPGQLSQPLRLGKGFCLVELIEFQNSKLDEATGEALLAEQMRLWIDSVVKEAETTLRWPNTLNTGGTP